MTQTADEINSVLLEIAQGSFDAQTSLYFDSDSTIVITTPLKKYQLNFREIERIDDNSERNVSFAEARDEIIFMAQSVPFQIIAKTPEHEDIEYLKVLFEFESGDLIFNFEIVQVSCCKMYSFNTQGFLYKCGFSDGDMLDDFAADHEVYGRGKRILAKVLIDLVIPQIKNTITWENRLAGSIHNPIRITSIDGHPIDEDGDTAGTELLPREILVSEDQILEIAKTCTAQQ